MKSIIKKTVFTATALSISLFTASNVLAAPEVTLRFSHFFPSVSGQHKDIFLKWKEAVESESAGRIAVELYPSSTLAKPPAQYDAVKNRIADITNTVQGYTANRFPLTQIVELPGVSKDATNGSCIVQTLYDEGLISKEYSETKPLFFFTHGAGIIHTVDKAIEKPEDLAGLRIRRPTAVVAKLLEGLGSEPIGMPAPSAYQSVQRGVIDGVALPWEGQLVFRLNELTNKHTEIGGLYTLAFVTTMNKRVYNGMPADLKKVIDNNSGMKWAMKAAAVYKDLDIKGRKQAEELGHPITTIANGVNNPEWKPILDKATEEYLGELEKKRLPARKVYKRAQELAMTCSTDASY